jgi:hypothetical protein
MVAIVGRQPVLVCEVARSIEARSTSTDLQAAAQDAVTDQWSRLQVHWLNFKDACAASLVNAINMATS